MSLTYIHLKPDSDLPELMRSTYRVLLVAEAAASDLWQECVAQWLVEAGCLYFMAWGKDCEAWHDCVDDANLKALNGDDIPDADLIVTTWHDDEPLSEVMWFAGHAAIHPAAELAATVILHVAAEAREVAVLEAYRAILTTQSSD